MASYYIDSKKTTFGFNFDLYQAVKQHGYTLHNTHKQTSQENLLIKIFFLITCKLLIQK